MEKADMTITGCSLSGPGGHRHGELDYTIRREESSELSRNEEPEPVGAEGDRVNPFFQSFSVVRTKSRFIRSFKGGAGVDIFLPGAGAEKEISGAVAEEKWLGSATQELSKTVVVFSRVSFSFILIVWSGSPDPQHWCTHFCCRNLSYSVILY